MHTSKFLEVLDGWFKAPASGDYQFYVSCDDLCQLEFDKDNDYESGNAASLSVIVDSPPKAQYFRDYQYDRYGRTDELARSTTTITLEENKHYRIRGQHRQWTGYSFFTVSAAILNSVTVDNSNHPNIQRETQWF